MTNGDSVEVYLSEVYQRVNTIITRLLLCARQYLRVISSRPSYNFEPKRVDRYTDEVLDDDADVIDSLIDSLYSFIANLRYERYLPTSTLLKTFTER